ncbi:hypothetical protein Tco_0550290 [Tanacetum coccineum]
MYGLHQAPRAWYGTLSKYLLDNGFQRGLQVLQKKDGIFLSQDKYVVDILKEFGYSDIRPANTPIDKENPWGKDRTGKDVELHLYRSMIGSLMYLTASRPDIMFAVCACARRQVTTKECHLHAVKRIFRYLKGHPKLGLWHPKESPFDLVAYSDSDYGGANQVRKSTTGGCQFLGKRFISWQCKKQTIVATSTTEAEYVAAASGCGQVLWIQNQLLDYGTLNTMIKLAFCNYHNMVAILEKTESNTDFHQIVDFLETSHIRQRTITESSIRRHLKLLDDEASPLHEVYFFLVVVVNLILEGTYAKQKLQDIDGHVSNLGKQQHLLMEQRIQSQDLEITQLKNIVKTLKEREEYWEKESVINTDEAANCIEQLFRSLIRTKLQEKLLLNFSHTSVPTINAKGKGKEKMVESTAKASGSKHSQEHQTKDSKELYEEELKKMMEIVPVEEVYIEALQAKYPIIEWEIYSEEQRKYWKIIRVGNHTEVYQTFEEIVKRFDREGSG